MNERTCDDCGGSGERETTDYCDVCPSCGGSGELPSVALVPVVGGDGPLVTAGYARDLMTLGLGFSYGWRAAMDLCAAPTPGTFPAFRNETYAEVRDFLRSEVEADELTACRLALWITRPSDAFFLGLGDLP